MNVTLKIIKIAQPAETMEIQMDVENLKKAHKIAGDVNFALISMGNVRNVDVEMTTVPPHGREIRIYKKGFAYHDGYSQ